MPAMGPIGLRPCPGVAQQQLAQRSQALTAAGTEKHPLERSVRPALPIGHLGQIVQPLGAPLGGQGIELVEHQHLRQRIGTDFGQHLPDLGNLLEMALVGGVDHMEQQIGIGRLLQGGLKSVNQAMGQIADETDRIGQRDRAGPGGAAVVAQVKLAGRGVERGKELVGGIGARLDQCIEERTFARIGIAHQANCEHLAAFALAPLRLALALEAGQPFLGSLDRLADHALVELDLLFARTAAHAGTAGLALQVRPAPHQPGRLVLQPRQLHLQLALVAARTLGKDFQNQQGPVVDRQLQAALEVALLGRTERLVKQHLGGPALLRQRLDFLGFATADKQGRVGGPALARHARNRCHASRLRQQAQLLQLAVKVGMTEINPHQQHGRRGFWGVLQGTQAGGLSSAVEKLTARPGTMVEIACL